MFFKIAKYGLVFAITALSYYANANDAIEQLRLFTKSTKSASGDFIQQQVTIQSNGQPRVNKEISGRFTFLRPGKFIWETTKPYQQKMIADGKQLAMWDKDLNQVTYRKADQAIAATPAAILFGNNSLEQYFDLKPVPDKGELQWVELSPKSVGGAQNDLPYSKIGIGLLNNLPQAMELRDNFGNVVLLTFKNIQANVPIAPNDFVFKIPPGTDVVKLP
jgi:outer membrane lipoprotein carrier protein